MSTINQTPQTRVGFAAAPPREPPDGARVAAVPPASGARAADASTPRFREQALAAHLRGDSPASVLQVSPPSIWMLFVIIAALVASGVAYCTFGRIEVTARGRGALRTAAGVIPIQAEIAGIVAEVPARSGQRVTAGQVLVKIDAAAVRASLLEADKHLDFVTRDLAPSTERRLAKLRARATLLQQRAALIRERLSRQQESAARGEQHRQDSAVLEAQGYVGRHQQDDADEVVTEALRRVLSLRQELIQSEADEDALDEEMEKERTALIQELEQARGRRDTAALMLGQTSIAAPRDGTVDAIIVRPGELVGPGTPVAKLVPPGVPSLVVAFVEERHRAFLHVGSTVRLEVDQLPVAEFGALSGTIVRISDDLASAPEIRDALGDAAGMAAAEYRVEIAVAATPGRPVQLRSGMLVTVRYLLRQRRIVTLALGALRKWFE